MKKRTGRGLLVVALALASVVSIGATTYAITPTLAIRCSTTQTHLNDRISKVEAVKVKQSATYDEVKTKLASVITSAETNGYDTSELTAAQTTLENAVDSYVSKTNLYTTSLSTAKNLTCGESNGDFVTAITASRVALTEARTAAASAKSSVSTTVVPALQAYATWLGEQSATGAAS